jgi:hypothetical protein
MRGFKKWATYRQIHGIKFTHSYPVKIGNKTFTLMPRRRAGCMGKVGGRRHKSKPHKRLRPTVTDKTQRRRRRRYYGPRSRHSTRIINATARRLLGRPLKLEPVEGGAFLRPMYPGRGRDPNYRIGPPTAGPLPKLPSRATREEWGRIASNHIRDKEHQRRLHAMMLK